MQSRPIVPHPLMQSRPIVPHLELLMRNSTKTIFPVAMDISSVHIPFRVNEYNTVKLYRDRVSNLDNLEGLKDANV